MDALTVDDLAAQDYIGLVWEVFFASRGRGLSLKQHFPSLDIAAPGQWFVHARAGQTLVGGLCVREADSEAGRVASLGLVCVAPEFRGQGFSTALIQRAVAEARSRGLAALRLWTGKPRVYLSHGFVIADDAMYGWVEKPQIPRAGRTVAAAQEDWPGATANAIGLPPFAHRGHRWQSDSAALIALEDGEGPIVAEWSGQTEMVAQIMEEVLPERARLNALAQDDLPDVLRQRGWRCSLARSQLQMVLALDRERNPQQLARLWTPRMLQRI